MRKIKLSEFAQAELEAEHLETKEDLKYLIEESDSYNTLAFFDIEYDSKTETLIIPDIINLEFALELVVKYIEVHEGNVIEKIDEVKDYYDHVDGDTLGDDAAFDYTGTYVLSILSIIAEHLAQ